MSESGWAVEAKPVPVELEPTYHHEPFESVLTPAEERAWTVMDHLPAKIRQQLMDILDNNQE